MALKKQAMTDSVSEVYAQALIEIADEEGNLDEVAEELRGIGELIEKDENLVAIFKNRAISEREKAGFIERVFKGKCGDSVYKFLQVVNQKDRLGALLGIIAAYEQLLRDKKGIVRVQAWVASELSEEEAKLVAKSVGETLGGKKVELEQEVDESLIGGLRIRVGDKLIDASVASQLNLIKQRLSEVGREKARLAAGTL